MSGVVHENRRSAQAILNSIHNTLWGICRAEINHQVFATNSHSLKFLLKMCRFILFSAPGHFAIVGAPMGEKDISACLRERTTNCSPNSSLAARTCNKSKTTMSVLRFHTFSLRERH